MSKAAHCLRLELTCQPRCKYREPRLHRQSRILLRLELSQFVLQISQFVLQKGERRPLAQNCRQHIVDRRLGQQLLDAGT